MSSQDTTHLTRDQLYRIIELYFSENYLHQLVKHQLESYNDFVNVQMMKTISMFNPLRIVSPDDYNVASGQYALEIFVTLENMALSRPTIYENNGAIKTMYPIEALLRNMSYESKTTVDMHVKYIVRSGENLQHSNIISKIIPKVNIGKLAIMVNSDLCVLKQNEALLFGHDNGQCSHDPGGYFIIKGSEKVVLGQERMAENKVFVFNDAKKIYRAEIKCVPDTKLISPKQNSMMIVKPKDDEKEKKEDENGEKKEGDSGEGVIGDVVADEEVADVKKPAKKAASAKKGKKSSKGTAESLFMNIPKFRNPIPLFILFRALGVLSDKEICAYILLDIDASYHKPMLLFLQNSIIEANMCLTQESATQYLSDNIMNSYGQHYVSKHSYVLETLHNELFPHCKTVQQKIVLLGYVAKRLLNVYFRIDQVDNRDANKNKRVDTTGILLNHLFRIYLNKMLKCMTKCVIKEVNHGIWRSSNDYGNILNEANIYKFVKFSIIENGIRRALSTGDFSIKQSGNNNKVGVAQVLTRISYMSAISHLRRISTPLDKTGKMTEPRKLSGSSWGFLCPVETPEGAAIGLVKNLATMTTITIPTFSEGLYDEIYALPDLIPLVEPKTERVLNPVHMIGKVKVFMNGTIVGFTDDALAVYKALKQKKLCGLIHTLTSIVFDIKMMEIHVCTDSGRLMRPLLRVCPKTRKPYIASYMDKIIQLCEYEQIMWMDLLVANNHPQLSCNEALIEYIDPQEHETFQIATYIKNMDENPSIQYTHCEIDPSAILGVLASCAPFPDFNQAPRNTYQCAMGKQAMGMYATNYDTRMDKTAYVLNYPSRPLVDTRLMDVLKMNQIPGGRSIMVAIMSYTGYNQEDSTLLNGGSVHRGLFQATIYHTEKDDDKQNANKNEEIRCKPDPLLTKGIKKIANYGKLNSQGLVPENTLIENRDIIMSKVALLKSKQIDPLNPIKYEDKSKMYLVDDDTYVDKNYLDKNEDGYTFAKVKLRTLRKPVIGDKFSSRHGQKGTCGLIVDEADMPYTANGLCPDIIINPHAIPSRMTIGHLKESLLGKVLVSLGFFGDGTSFGDLDIVEIADILQMCGFESYGNELMHNPLTGEQMECPIFIAPIFYQRLKHMVADKQHSRATGPMCALTQQPPEGRRRKGGMRFGEMEKDCTVSHGISKFTRGRMLYESDYYQTVVCKQCGSIAAFNDEKHVQICHLCDNYTDFGRIEIPWSSKLMFHELKSMHVSTRLMIEN